MGTHGIAYVVNFAKIGLRSAVGLVPMQLWAKLDGKYINNYFYHKSDIGCVCMLNDWIGGGSEIYANSNKCYQSKLEGIGGVGHVHRPISPRRTDAWGG